MNRRLLFAPAAAVAVNGTAVLAADQSRVAVTSPPRTLRGAGDDNTASPVPSGRDVSTGKGIASRGSRQRETSLSLAAGEDRCRRHVGSDGRSPPSARDIKSFDPRREEVPFQITRRRRVDSADGSSSSTSGGAGVDDDTECQWDDALNPTKVWFFCFCFFGTGRNCGRWHVPRLLVSNELECFQPLQRRYMSKQGILASAEPSVVRFRLPPPSVHPRTYTHRNIVEPLVDKTAHHSPASTLSPTA